MLRIVFADDTNRYDGRTSETRPLGGTESSVCFLAEALAARGHDVTALTHCERPIEHDRVRWTPLGGPRPADTDVFVAVVHPHLLGAVGRARRRFLWLCWPPDNLARRRKILPMWLRRPFPIFVSEHQTKRYPLLLPRPPRTVVIPFGLADYVRGAAELATPPPPRAIFASNPVRNLDWLLRLWSRLIHPQMPEAELHVYGIRDYDHVFGRPMSAAANRWVAAVPEHARKSIVFQPIVPHRELAPAMRGARVLLYGGHDCEVFCLAVAEAQALGVPAVVRPIAVLPERVVDGVSGFVRDGDEAFADAALRLLRDGELWRRQHREALRRQQGCSWHEVAERMERLFLEELGGGGA
ncbi:MAG: glycosyltransferase family 4 protein [Candidatus Binatia bacterium]